MKYYIKDLLIVLVTGFLILVTNFIISAKTNFYEFFTIECYNNQPFLFFLVLIILVFLNFILKDKLSYFLRLFCLIFFGDSIFELFWAYFINPSSVIFDMPFKNLFRHFALMNIIGIAFSGYFFYNYKPNKKDLIWIFVWFIILYLIRETVFGEVYSYMLNIIYYIIK